MTKEQENCPYCHDKDGKPLGIYHYLGKEADGFSSTSVSFKFNTHTKYCQFCGRKLEK